MSCVTDPGREHIRMAAEISDPDRRKGTASTGFRGESGAKGFPGEEQEGCGEEEGQPGGEERCGEDEPRGWVEHGQAD
jgi:hypothetical protein